MVKLKEYYLFNSLDEKDLKILESISFEKEFAKYIGSEYAVGVDNGLNALVLAFRALEIGFPERTDSTESITDRIPLSSFSEISIGISFIFWNTSFCCRSAPSRIERSSFRVDKSNEGFSDI